MRILLAVCAFSAFLSSGNCMDNRPAPIPSVVVVTRIGATESLFFDHGKLFWIDVNPPELCCRHEANRAIYCARLALNRVYFAVPVAHHPDVFLVGSPTAIILVRWDAKSDVRYPPMNPLRIVAGHTDGHRINHGKVDPRGRLWFGTVNDLDENYMEPMGNVHTIDVSLFGRTQILETFWSQGIVWDMLTDPPKCYFVDALSLRVVSFTYNQGRLSEGRVIIHFPRYRIYGTPGNLAIDQSGHLWVPMFGTSQVVEVNPVTKLPNRIIEVEAKKVIGCTFGGRMMETLYIATQGYGRENADEIHHLEDVWAGSIFAAIIPGVVGRPTNRFLLEERYIEFPH